MTDYRYNGDTYLRLNNSTYWTDGNGVAWPINTMTHTHRENVINYLLVNAGKYEKEYTAYEICKIIGWSDKHPNEVMNDVYAKVAKRRANAQLFIRMTNVYKALWEANYGPPEPPIDVDDARFWNDRAGAYGW